MRGADPASESSARARRSGFLTPRPSNGYVWRVTVVLGTLVALGFLWSIVLFFAAVFVRERDQEGGFGWALLGAAAFVVTFADHLPGGMLGLRHVLEVLPDVSRADTEFRSPITMLVILAVVYALRFIIFYQLFIDLRDYDIDGDGEPDDVNDLVAPFLSYVGFSLCAVTALSGVYGLALGVTLILALASLPLYYLTHVVRFFTPYLDVIYETARSAVIIVWQRAMDALIFMIIGIGRAELSKRGADTKKIDERARTRRADSVDRVNAARARRGQALADLAAKRRTEERRNATRRAGRRSARRSDQPPDPNVR